MRVLTVVDTIFFIFSFLRAMVVVILMGIVIAASAVVVVARERVDVEGGCGGRLVENIGAVTVLEVLKDWGEEGHQWWRMVIAEQQRTALLLDIVA